MITFRIYQLSDKGEEDSDQLKLENLLRAIIGLLGLFGIKATEEQFRVCLQVIRKAQTARYVSIIILMLFTTSF